MPSDHHGQIRLNLRGRERDGIVDPSEADELCGRIAEGLLSFRDEGGGACVSAVDRAESIVGSGAPALRLLPDLLVRWGETPSARLRAVESPRFGRIERTGSGSGRAGGHTDDAFAILVPGRSRLAKRNGDDERGRPDGDRVRPPRGRHVGARRDAAARAARIDPAYARTSGLYLIRCGSSASAPFVSFTHSAYSSQPPSNHVT